MAFPGFRKRDRDGLKLAMRFIKVVHKPMGDAVVAVSIFYSLLQFKNGF